MQIYIVASDTSADKGEQGVQSEGLLVLVQPQLPNLSQLWLSALRDHALLLLPSSKLNFEALICNVMVLGQNVHFKLFAICCAMKHKKLTFKIKNQSTNDVPQILFGILITVMQYFCRFLKSTTT